MKRQSTDLGEIVVNHVSDQGLWSRIKTSQNSVLRSNPING